MIINQLAVNKLVTILGWTIIHSLWQGIITGFILALVLLLLREQSSKFKYNCALILALLFTGVSVFTFAYTYQKFDSSLAAVFSDETGAVVLVSNAVIHNANTMQFFQYLTQLLISMQQYLPLVVILWGIGVLILSFRFTGGLLYAQSLKRKSILPAPVQWQVRVDQFAAKLCIRQCVTLLQSARIKIPMVIGSFKPVILLPLGYLTGLPQSQVEAILAHELAHISRKDYLVNLIFSVISIIYFYHPVIWWISYIIRKERENCCDDLAIALTGDHIVLARALTTVYEKQFAPTAAMALFNHKKMLFNRIKRLTRKSATEFNPLSGLLVSCLVIIGALIVYVNARAQFTTTIDMPPVPAVVIVPADLEAPEQPAPVDAPLIRNEAADIVLVVDNSTNPDSPALSASVPDKPMPPDTVNALKDVLIIDSSMPFSFYFDSLTTIFANSPKTTNPILVAGKHIVFDSLKIPGFSFICDSSQVVIPHLPGNMVFSPDFSSWNLPFIAFDSTKFQKAMENFKNLSFDFDTSHIRIMTRENLKNFNFSVDSVQMKKIMDSVNNIQINFDSSKIAEMQKMMQHFHVQLDSAKLHKSLKDIYIPNFNIQEFRRQQLKQMQKQRELLDKQIESLNREIEQEQKGNEK